MITLQKYAATQPSYSFHQTKQSIIRSDYIYFGYIRQQMKNETYRSIFRDQPSKSLNKFKIQGQGKVNHLASVQRRKQQGNIYTITTNASHFSTNKDNNKKEQEYLRKIKQLENELKRKLTEDCLLRNIFKTKITSELSHTDLYLQLKKYEQSLKLGAQRERQFKNKIDSLQQNLQKMEQQHIQHIQMLGESIEQKQKEWKSEKNRIELQMARFRQDSENNKFLLQEIQKKYSEVNIKLKEANDELEIEREANILGQLKEKQEHQNQVESLLLKIQQLKKQKTKLQDTLEENYNQRQHIIRQFEQLKDAKEKLQLRVKEIEQVNNEINATQREEKEKYQQYYEKVKINYEIEIENILNNHEEQLLKQAARYSSLGKEKQNLEEEIEKLLKRLQQSNIKFAKVSEQNKEVNQRQKLVRDQFHSLQDKVIKLSRELLQIRFQKEELSVRLQKAQLSLQQKLDFTSKLENKILQLNSLNSSTLLQCEQYKKQAEVNQSYLKINNKIYNDNYKTLGRLIEINNKIKSHLGHFDSKPINQQSLGEVASCLTEWLEKFISASNGLKSKYEELMRQRNIQNRQIFNILEQCKLFLHNQYSQDLLSKYISIIKDRKNIHNEEMARQRLQIYHELVENLMNLNSMKYYHSQHSNQIHLKDSLQSTYLQRDTESNKKFSRHIFDKSESNKQVRRKEKIDRVQTEPICDIPSKANIFGQDQNKQNVSLNVNKNLFDQRDSKNYINHARQKISNKLCGRSQSKNSRDFRSEIEKKYFRS